MRKHLLIVICILLVSTFVFSQYSGQDKYPANAANSDQYSTDSDRYPGDQDQYQAQYYDNAKVLRVKYSEGETYVQRSYEEGYEEAAMNLSIFEKDTVGTTEGRVEIYLGRLNYLRLDYDTEVDIERAPELRHTNMSFRIKRGGIYLDIQNLDNERDIEIQTPDCGVFLLNKGVYRINVNENGRTNIFVHEGLVEVSGNNYSRYVRENQKIVMVDGRVAENPYYFYASRSDEFDQWNKERNSAGGYARYGTSRYLANGYEDYEYELSRYGRWVYYNDYREYIWIPYNIGSSWSPYYNGRWIWNPHYGYVWDSYDHWGYFTHHYGRWHWDNHYGWYWYPGYHWSPAWVYWFWDNDYYGWCPLSRWNRPVIIINNRWMRNYNHRREGIPIHSRSTVIIKKHNLDAPHIDRVTVNKATLKSINIASKGFSPKERPALEKVKVINARNKTVAYKKSGFLESHKYETVKPGVGPAAKESEFKYKEKGKNTEKRAFKYSKSAQPVIPGSPGTEGREVKKEIKEGREVKKEIRIEKKEAVVSPGENIPEKKVFKPGQPLKYKEKSVEGSEAREKTRTKEQEPAEVPKAKYKPSEPKERKKTDSSDTSSKGTESKGTATSSTSKTSSTSSSLGTKKIKVKEKEKNYPSFSSSERYYPSSSPNASDSNSSSYRSTRSTSSTYPSYAKRSTRSAETMPRYKSYQGTRKNDNSSARKYVPSYPNHSQYPDFVSRNNNSGYSSRETKNYSTYSSSRSSHSSSSYPSNSSSSSRYSSSSSRSSSSSFHPSSSSSHSSSSHSSYSRSSSSGSHGSVAVKRKD